MERYNQEIVSFKAGISWSRFRFRASLRFYNILQFNAYCTSRYALYFKILCRLLFADCKFISLYIYIYISVIHQLHMRITMSDHSCTYIQIYYSYIEEVAILIKIYCINEICIIVHIYIHTYMLYFTYTGIIKYTSLSKKKKTKRKLVSSPSVSFFPRFVPSRRLYGYRSNYVVGGIRGRRGLQPTSDCQCSGLRFAGQESFGCTIIEEYRGGNGKFPKAREDTHRDFTPAGEYAR